MYAEPNPGRKKPRRRVWPLSVSLIFAVGLMIAALAASAAQWKASNKTTWAVIGWATPAVWLLIRFRKMSPPRRQGREMTAVVVASAVGVIGGLIAVANQKPPAPVREVYFIYDDS